MLLAAPAWAAQDMAPVQVQIEQDDMIYFYDCWPSQAPQGMVVYLTYPEGVAAYGCFYDGRVLPKPLHKQTEMAYHGD